MAVELTELAPYTFLVVGIIAAIMAWLGYRSYQATGNTKLLFIVIAFVVIVLRSLLVMFNEWSPTHPIDHHTEVVIIGVFDIIVVLLFFVPFFAKPRTDR